MRLKLIVLLLVATLAATGCGYHIAKAKTNTGAGRTLAIPTFTNKTARGEAYRVEQRISDSIRREFIRDTKFNVTSETTGDVLISGEVTDYRTVPILFNEQGRASSYVVAMVLKVVMTDTKTGAVLFRNDNWTFREPFELGQTSAEFVPEDPAAVERLAKRVASTLVATYLHRTP